VLLVGVLGLTLAGGQHSCPGDAFKEELEDLNVPTGLGEVAAPRVQSVARE
jgi:hypothetical protein